MASVVAVVLNWRDSPSTIACLDSPLTLAGDVSIVVVDNTFGDGFLERIREYIDECAPGLGYAVINAPDIGAQTIGARWIMVLSSGRNGGYASATMSASGAPC